MAVEGSGAFANSRGARRYFNCLVLSHVLFSYKCEYVTIMALKQSFHPASVRYKFMPHQQGKRIFKPDFRFTTMAVCVFLVIVLSLILWLYPNGSIAAISLIVLTAITAIANLGQWLTPTFTPAEAPSPNGGTSRPLPAPGPLVGSDVSQSPAQDLPSEESDPLSRPVVLDITVVQKRPPFFFCVHLPDRGELYGRNMARDTIVSRASHGGSTSLVGERRIGKSWLLEYTQLILPSTQIKSS